MLTLSLSLKRQTQRGCKGLKGVEGQRTQNNVISAEKRLYFLHVTLTKCKVIQFLKTKHNCKPTLYLRNCRTNCSHFKFLPKGQTGLYIKVIMLLSSKQHSLNENLQPIENLAAATFAFHTCTTQLEVPLRYLFSLFHFCLFRSVINPPTRSLWIQWGIPCCVLTSVILGHLNICYTTY